MKETIIWLIFVLACVTLVVTIQILTMGDFNWLIKVVQVIIIGKMIGGTVMYQEAFKLDVI